ncbi:DUF6231 family protein [Pseudomaricurvus sp. HS19]|uniref:DUF6231 family protein n=1 Tax=Pseudomaricurvus sp. HS19 TaxID=2692626 RepID=UPI0013691B3B|nr:DUF6231 family protein [Pseudomaricurvus sp. HS19]MYM64993.1 hypothetical protein [Pseudomaricurvus sp. HS19]
MQEQTPEQALLQHLTQQAPRHLLLVAADCPPALQRWCDEQGCALTCVAPGEDPGPQAGGQRFELAVALVPDSDTAARLLESHQLGVIRNLFSSAIWLLVQETQQAPRSELLALGFSRLQHFDGPGLSCYGYNLSSYNRQRSWNTPRYWANPENWGKYRW